MATQSQLSPQAARNILWSQGVIHWLLHPGQKDLYDAFHKCNEKVIVFTCSRRLGKSTALCVLAIESCLKNPNSIIRYCCAKQVEARNIIRPLIREITKTCPKEYRPRYKTADKAYVFPNGSRIDLTGLDGGRAESIRGGSCTMAIIDEAALVDDLKYIIRSIILPTTTTTKGKIILASTPPKSSDHPYIYFHNKARTEGNLITKNIYDNPLIDPTELKKIIDECGGVNSVEFRREYLCHIIIDTEKAVVPEFTAELKELVVKKWEKPPFYDAYVSMDLGLKDLTVVLFAYYDFRSDKLIIEDEFVLNGQKFNTDTLAQGIRKKEQEVFSNKITGEVKIPFIRVSDNNLIVINDLRQLHGLLFQPTRKDDKDAALNNMRMMLGNERIYINPRCTTLITHLETAIWNKQKTSYARSEENAHYDAIDALCYLVRNVLFTKNPYPAHFGAQSRINQYQYKNCQEYSPYMKLFNIKPNKS